MAECKDRELQMRVRRLHAKLRRKKSGVASGASGESFNVAVKTCSEQSDEAGFAKLSKREPFGGKLVPGESCEGSGLRARAASTPKRLAWSN